LPLPSTIVALRTTIRFSLFPDDDAGKACENTETCRNESNSKNAKGRDLFIFESVQWSGLEQPKFSIICETDANNCFLPFASDYVKISFFFI